MKKKLKNKSLYNENGNKLVTLSEPYSYTSEQFKKLRTIILDIKNEKSIRTILVTSAIQGEGKSTVASNLAISLSQGISEFVLLVDCDLRIPSLHKFFKINMESEKKGLSDYLNGDVDLSDIIVKTGINKLNLMTAGKAVTNPAELVASDKMEAMIYELRSKYKDRYIIIDSPPVLPTTEPTFLANFVDAVVLVLGAGKTPRALLEKSIKSINRERILGIVFNNCKKDKSSNYYESYYKKR